MKTSGFLHHAVRIAAVALLLLCRSHASEPPPPELLAMDSDGDGQPDVAEWFNRTDPANSQDVIRITSIEPLTAPARLRVTWRSVPGQVYAVDQSPGTGPWTRLTQVTAAGTTSSFTLPFPTGDPTLLLRVAAPYDTTRPPFVRRDGTSTPVTAAGFVQISVTAYHPDGIRSVTLQSDGLPLTPGSPGANGTWTFLWPVDASQNGNQSIILTAATASGLVQSSTLSQSVNIPAGPPLTGLPGQFVKLDAAGEPLESATLLPDVNGNLPPCEWRPAGTAPEGGAQWLALRFRQGGKVFTGASPRIEFTRVELAGGPRGLLVPDGIVGHSTTAVQALPLGELTVAQLSGALGLGAAEGIPVRIFGLLPARLHGGTLGKDGLAGPLLTPAGELFAALPPLGGFGNFALDFTDPDTLRLPFSGEFSLPDASGFPATLKIGPQAPAWVKFRRDGALSFEGRGELNFGADGPRFLVELAAGDPELSLEIAASGLQAGFGAAVKPSLPPAQTLTAATPANAATLDPLAGRLGARVRAYERFAAAFADAAPSGATTPPREVRGGTSSLLDSLASAVFGGTSAAAPSGMGTFVERAGRAASGGTNLPASLEHWLTLERVKLAGFSSAELSAAREEARNALRRRFDSTGKPFSLEDAYAAMTSAAERFQLMQQTGAAEDSTPFLTEMAAALNAALLTHAASLGVVAGHFAPAADSPVMNMDRFTAFQNLSTLAGAIGHAQRLGLDGDLHAPVGELLGQLGRRVESVLRAAFEDAESRGDAAAFLYALEDYTELHGWHQSGLFQGGAVLDLLSLDSLLTRYSVLAEAWIPAQQLQWPVEKEAAQAERLTKILKAVPAGITVPQATITRAYDRLLQALTTGISAMGTSTRLTDARALLRGGAEQARLRDQMNLPAGSPEWESAARLSAVVDKIVALASAAEDAVALHECAVLLLSEAERLAPGNQTRRRANLLEAQKLAAALRAVAIAWCNRAPGGGQSILAGGVAVDEAAGGLKYNTQSKEISGWCSGKMRLPGAGAAFTLSRLSFSNGGAFDLECYGSVTLPPGANSAARFTVPARRPLHFSYRRPGSLSLSGGGRLEVNGMTFEAWTVMDDPLYVFGASASGLSFDLGDKLRIMVPVPPSVPALSAAFARDVVDGVESIGAAFEPLVNLDLPVPPSPGAPPEFSAALPGAPFAMAEAWANRHLAAARLGLSADISGSLAEAKKLVAAAAGHLQLLVSRECITGASFEEAVAAIRLLLAYEKAGVAWPAVNTGLGQEILYLRTQLIAYFTCLFQHPEVLSAENEVKVLEAIDLFLVRGATTHANLPPGLETLHLPALNYVLASLQVRLPQMGLDASTAALTDEDTLLGMTLDRNQTILTGMILRRHLLALAEGVALPLPYSPAAAQSVVHEAQHHLFRARRHLLVLAARENLSTFPGGEGIGNRNGFVPQGHPVLEKARAHARTARRILDSRLELETMVQLYGDAPLAGERYIRTTLPDLIWPAAGDPNAGSIASQFFSAETIDRMLPVEQIVSAEDPRRPDFRPILSNVVYAQPGGAPMTVTVRPRLEGLYDLDVPFGAVPAGMRKLVPEPKPQDPAALHNAWQAYVGSLPGLQRVPLDFSDALISRFQVEVARYVALPATEAGVEAGLTLAAHLAALLDMAANADAPLLPQLQLDIARFDTAFRAVLSAKKAWWYAAAYARLWADAAERGALRGVTALQQTAGGVMSAAAQTGLTIVRDVAMLLPASRPADLALPGELRIESVRGEISYRRDTQVLSGSFGGRLELPGQQAYFEVVDLSLNSTGAFSISLSGGGPLPFAPDIQIQNVTGTVTGSTAGLTAFSAAGTLRFPGDSGEVSLPGAFTYLGAAGGQPAKVKFTAGLTGAQNLPRFTDDLVLFNGALGVEFPLTQTPPPVKLSMSGKAGLFHRESPLTAPVVAEDFWLSVDLTGLEMLFESAPTHRVTLTFNGGTLRFPADLFSTRATPPALPQPFTVALGGGLTGCFDFDQRALCFGNAAGGPYLLNLPTLGFFNIPGLPESKVEVTTAQLRLEQSQFPVLASLAANFRFPLPGQANEPSAAAFRLNATEWRIDGLPQQASLQLTEDLSLLPWLQEASLSALSGASVQLTDAALPARPGYRRMTLTASGGMRAGLNPQTISAENGGSVAFSTTGTFSWPFDYRPFQSGVPPQAPEPQVPSLSVQDVVFEGRFRLGGANGLLIRGTENTPASKAKLVFSGGQGGNLENVLHRTAARPFSVGFAGTLDIPAVAAFTLGDITNPSQLTRFVWDQNGSVIPRFLPAGFNVALSGQALGVVDLAMPLYLTSAGFAFLNQNLTLPSLLDPSNIKIIASGVAQFPNGAAISLGSPGLRGEFSNVVMTFPRVNGNYSARLENISALTMELKNLSVPYVSDVSGSVSVRNIEALQANPPRPLDVYFAGEVRGKMRGAGVNVLFAASPREFLGACAGLSGGVSGIPLDGYALGGILLSGLEGGLSLQNHFANPCDFRSYVNAPPGAQQMPPPGSPQRPGNPGPLLFPDPPGAPSSQFFDCTGPGFPPPTVNPFCQAHPTIPGRIIYKGARLTAAQLNSLGITSSDPRLALTIAQGLDACMAGVDFAVQQTAMAMTSGLTTELQRMRNLAAGNPTLLKLLEQAANDGLGLAGSAGAALDSAIADQCRAVFRSALLDAFEQGTAVNPGQTLYQLIVTRADEGLKCVDVTVRGNGTLTWQPLSILFDATGSVFLSTTGTEGVEGSLNFLGIPMARGTAAFMITDESGDVNPGLGGVADLAIGPFGFGKVSLAAQSGASVNSVVIQALTALFATADTLAPAVKSWMAGILQDVAGLPAPPASLQSGFLGLTEEQRLRLMSRFLAESKQLAVSVSDPVVRDQLFDVIAGLLADVLQSQESTMCMGGQVAPTLFGMPLTGGADTLVGGGVRYQPVMENGTRYYEMSGQVTFSPTIVSLYPILYSYATALPQLDEATLGVSIRAPSPDKNGVKLALTNPAQWAKNMTNAVINDTVATANYSIAPLGFRLQDVRARVILPRIERHPDNPAAGWTGPPSGNAFATREEVVLAALDRGNLGNAQWRGNAGDLDDLFRNVPGGTQCSALTQQTAARLLAADPALAGMSGKGFAADYFPHGGLIYGGQWQMPNVVAQAPPLQTIATVLAGPQPDGEGNVPPQSVLSWINTTKGLVDDYFLATTCTGQLAGYVPAPSPVPAGVNWSALQADPSQWLSALTNPGGLLGAAFPGSLNDNAAYATWATGRRDAALGLLDKVVHRDALLNGIYPFEQSFLRGWCQAPLLGLPLAQASASWDGQTRRMLITAQAAPGGWLAQYVGGNFILEVSPPQYVAGVTSPEPAGTAADSPEERLTALRSQLDGITTTNYAAQVPALTNALLHVLPRVKLDTSVNFTPPAAWQTVLGTTALTGRLYAYSAGFDTAAAGTDPESIAKRHGGILLRADMSFGPFLRAANACTALTPDGNSLPRLNADFSVNGLTLPGPAPVSILLAGGRATFDSRTGAYSIQGSLSQNLTLPSSMLPWNVTMPAASTTVSASGNSVTFTFSYNGSSATVTVTSTATSSSATFQGVLEIDPLLTGIFSIQPGTAGATKLRLTISNGITAALTSARLRIGGPFHDQEIPLPPLTLSHSFDFPAVTPAAVDARLRSYLLSNFQCSSVLRSGGVLSVSSVSCQLPPAAPLPAISLSGSLFSNGAFSLTSGAVTPALFGFGASGSFTLTNAPASPAYQTRISSLAPQAYWKLDETSGTTALDATGHGHTGTHAGAPVISQTGAGWPPAGKSYLLNGTSARVSIPDADLLEGGSAMTIMAWAKVNAFTMDWQPLVTKGDTTWRLHRYANTRFLSFGTNTPAYHDLVSSVPLDDGQWHHIAGVFTGTKKLLYIDGRLNAQADVTGSLAANTSALMLGGNAEYPARLWNGGLDEVAYFRSALDSEAVRDLYASAIGAALTFNGTVSVPGFSAASFAVNGKVAADSSWSLTGTLPALNTGSFALTPAAGGSLTATLGSSGITVAATQLSQGEWFTPLDLPAFTIPSTGDYQVALSPAELNVRGYRFPAPALTFRRSGGVTALDCTSSPPTLPGLPAVALSGSISSSGAVSLTAPPNTTHGFPNWSVTGNIGLGAPPVVPQTLLSSLAPQAYWKLDEVSGTKVADASGHAHHGTRAGGITQNLSPALFPAAGRSYAFAGTDGAITVADDNNLEGGSAMSVTAWIRTGAFTRDWQAIVTKGDTAWRLTRYSNSSRVSFESTSGGGAHSLPGTTNVTDGKWHHLAAVYDGAFKSLYVDGRLEARAAYTSVIDSNAQPVMIGENAEATGRNWNGGIDEVAFFRRGLSAAEVRELYAAGNGLRLFLTGTANLPGINPSVSGTITSGGGFDFATSATSSPAIFGYGFNTASFLFQRLENPDTTTFTGTLRLNALPAAGSFAPLSGTPVFNAVFTRENAANPPLLQFRTRASLTADDLNFTLCGYAPRTPGFDLGLNGFLDPLIPVTVPLTFSDFRFASFPDIGDIGFLPLKGTVGTNGIMKVTHVNNLAIAGGTGEFIASDLNLRNLHAPDTFVTFNHNGLNISSVFHLDVTVAGFTRDLGDAAFAGRIEPNGSFNLAGNGSIVLGVFSTDSFPMRFRSAGYGTWSIAPETGVIPNLNFGSLDMPLTGFGLHQNGLGYSMSKTLTRRDNHHLFTGSTPHLRTEFSSTVSLSYDFTSNNLNGSLSGRWNWFVENFSPPPGFASSGGFDISGGISSNGSFTVNNNTASGSAFFAPYWDNNFLWAPPATWIWGNIGSTGYTLW